MLSFLLSEKLDFGNLTQTCLLSPKNIGKLWQPLKKKKINLVTNISIQQGEMPTPELLHVLPGAISSMRGAAFTPGPVWGCACGVSFYIHNENIIILNIP